MAAIMTAPHSSHLPQFNRQDPPPTHKSTEELLIDKSKTLIRLLNSRKYDDPFFYAHVRQNVYTSLNGRCTVGLHPFTDNHRRDAAGSIAFFVDAEFNVTALVDEDNGSATVIMSQHLSGYGDRSKWTGMATAGTILFSWQRSKGKWWCGNATMIYGTPEFLV